MSRKSFPSCMACGKRGHSARKLDIDGVPTTDPKVYLSTSEGRWRVINQGMPVCRDTDEASARECAAKFKLDISHGRVWNGDRGAWEVRL